VEIFTRKFFSENGRMDTRSIKRESTFEHCANISRRSAQANLSYMPAKFFFLSLAYAAMAQPLHRGIRCCVEGSETTFKLVYRAAVNDVWHGLGGSTDTQWAGFSPSAPGLDRGFRRPSPYWAGLWPFDLALTGAPANRSRQRPRFSSTPASTGLYACG